MTELRQTAASVKAVILSIRAKGMKSVRYGRDHMAADAFYEVENQTGKVITRSCILTDVNPCWPPLEFKIQGGRSRKISLVFYDYNPKKPRRSFELACIETSLDELYEAVAAHKKNRDKPSYSLHSAGLEVYICDLEEKVRVLQSSPDLADDITSVSSKSNPLVPILENDEEDEDHRDILSNNNFIGIVDETELVEGKNSKAGINCKEKKKEETVAVVVESKIMESQQQLSTAKKYSEESRAVPSSNSSLSSTSSVNVLNTIAEHQSTTTRGSKETAPLTTIGASAGHESKLAGYDQDEPSRSQSQGLVTSAPVVLIRSDQSDSRKKDTIDICKSEKDEEAISAMAENDFLESKQQLPTAKIQNVESNARISSNDSAFTSTSSSTEIDATTGQDSKDCDDHREDFSTSSSTVQKSLPTEMTEYHRNELKPSFTSPSSVISGSYQEESNDHGDYDVRLSCFPEKHSPSSILVGRFRGDPMHDNVFPDCVNEDEVSVSNDSCSSEEGDHDQKQHFDISNEDSNLSNQSLSRRSLERQEMPMIELQLLATGINSLSSNVMTSHYYYEVENEEGDKVGRSPSTPSCSEKNVVCSLDFNALCGGNRDRKISLIFYHNSVEIACIETSITELHRAAKAYQLQTGDEKRESFGIDGNDDNSNINGFKVFICHVEEINTTGHSGEGLLEKTSNIVPHANQRKKAKGEQKQKFRLKNKFQKFKNLINKKKPVDVRQN
mmetsp:Transcript_27801/g.42064  ORF Transcript_27801/g.42064 Transcript_27801/m.42064 type:complete len:728 (+) Transcript_27801:195-2378(+)|eukprot:CAMPEP_0178902514 /NCGR_PEP_ID=MMETSP0786-20121207/4646_1 /TAXON_ID=186022 /ORGANISM="Thalassionema frauenfeldii, Strain CCMP 1798" /LENGTH=727 /DNA_ID=CAMNT_0020573787 /DNA_START=141 /DNA_END=2324 /DNA_ORIENTATION=+